MTKCRDYVSNYRLVAEQFKADLKAAAPGVLVKWPQLLDAADAAAIVREVQEARHDADVRETTFCPLEDLAVAPPVRVQILEEGAKLTNGNRDKSYGPPKVNLAAAGELKVVFRKHMTRELSPGELEAIDMVLTKIGRVATAPVPVRDTYVDGATYFAIAGEIALDLS